MWLQSMAFERGLAKLEMLTLLPFRYDLAQSHLDKGFHGCVFLLSHLTRFLEKAVRYMYGCFHTYNHIMKYGSMSRSAAVRAG